MTQHDILSYLDDICEQAENISASLNRMTYQEYLRDPLYNGGIIRFVEVIGEAVKHIPNDIREKYPEVEWK